MSTPNMGQPQLLSNEIEDFAAGGGLYPGGTLLVEEFCYKLWDYDGKRPVGSQCAAYLRGRPMDGSNEGKPVEAYYSVGSSSDYLPSSDGGSVVSLRGKNFMDSTNWGAFLKQLRTGCGLERGRLSTQAGIRVMQQGILTVVKSPQPHRDFDDLPKTKEQEEKDKKFPRTMLLPSRAVFSWDPNYQRAMQNVPPPPTGQAQAPVPAPAPAQTNAQAPAYVPPAQGMPQAPPPVPTQQMAPNGDFTLPGVIRAILTRNGGSLSLAGNPTAVPPVPSLAAQVLTELGTNVERNVRVAMAKECNPASLAVLAQANGWTLAGDDLIG